MLYSALLRNTNTMQEYTVCKDECIRELTTFTRKYRVRMQVTNEI